MGDPAPQAAKLVRVHLVEGGGLVGAHQLVRHIVLHHLLYLCQAQRIVDLISGQQHGEQEEGALVGSILVVAVAVKDEGGAWGQAVEAVDDSRRFVPLESCAELRVNVQLDLVAVRSSSAGPVEVEDGGVQRGGEGRGQTLSQAAQRPLGSEAGSQDQTDRLSRLGQCEVVLKVELAPLPQIRPLVGELGLEKRQAVQKRRGVHRAGRGNKAVCGSSDRSDDLVRQEDSGWCEEQQEKQPEETPDKPYKTHSGGMKVKVDT